MDYKSILEEFNKDLRDLQMRYLYIPMNDYLWEHVIREQDEIGQKYKAHGKAFDKFARAVLVALAIFKEDMEKNGYDRAEKKNQ